MKRQAPVSKKVQGSGAVEIPAVGTVGGVWLPREGGNILGPKIVASGKDWGNPSTPLVWTGGGVVETAETSR